jgi:hypothetical protein
MRQRMRQCGMRLCSTGNSLYATHLVHARVYFYFMNECSRTNFAKYLNPNGEGADTASFSWPAYDAERESNIVMAYPLGVDSFFTSERCDVMDGLAPALRVAGSNGTRGAHREEVEAVSS